MQFNPIGGTSMKKLFSRRTLAAFAVIGASSLILTACSSSSDDAGGDKVGVSLILKNDTNPFFVAMTAGAKAKAAELGVDLSVASGKDETDDAAGTGWVLIDDENESIEGEICFENGEECYFYAYKK